MSPKLGVRKGHKVLKNDTTYEKMPHCFWKLLYIGIFYHVSSRVLKRLTAKQVVNLKTVQTMPKLYKVYAF